MALGSATVTTPDVASIANAPPGFCDKEYWMASEPSPSEAKAVTPTVAPASASSATSSVAALVSEIAETLNSSASLTAMA